MGPESRLSPSIFPSATPAMEPAMRWLMGRRQPIAENSAVSAINNQMASGRVHSNAHPSLAAHPAGAARGDGEEVVRKMRDTMKLDPKFYGEIRKAKNDEIVPDDE